MVRTIAGLLFLLVFGIVPHELCAVSVDHHGYKVNLDIVDVCMTCHDGPALPSRKVGNATCGTAQAHPQSMEYPPKHKATTFNSRSYVLSHGIRLAGNKIVCFSCHDLDNPQPKHLAVEDTNSRLCLTCHIK